MGSEERHFCRGFASVLAHRIQSNSGGATQSAFRTALTNSSGKRPTHVERETASCGKISRILWVSGPRVGVSIPVRAIPDRGAPVEQPAYASPCIAHHS